MGTETKIYFKHGDIVAEAGDARVYSMDDQLFLEVGKGHDLWALESEYKDYMNQFATKQPKGKCLEVGLGLGIAARCIMTFPDVTHLTSVEKNRNVIATHEALIYLLDYKTDKWMPYDYTKHQIVNDLGLNYLLRTKEKFDFIFLDFYKLIDEDSIPEIRDMAKAARGCLNKGGTVVGWLDPFTPPDYYREFEKIFD